MSWGSPWGSVSEFFAMGGYAFFVWGSYGAAFIALAAEPWLAARAHRRALLSVAEAAHDEAALSGDSGGNR
jgi:heme exporter protein D